MKNPKNLIYYVLAIPFIFTACASSDAPKSYEPTWESLAKHNEAPEWFRDAKLGIYFHWGVYSVPAYGNEWYPRNMHNKQRHEYKHHVKTYGDPTEFGYADFVSQFKAEKFDPEQWAILFKKAGARFAGPVSEHHDGFSMWDSELTPWNSKDKGPKRDITGELEKAIRKQGMKYITTFHHARNSLWEYEPGKWTGHYDHVKKDFPALLDHPENAIMYGYMPRDEFEKMWKSKLIEVIDKYQPDIIWFDSWLHEISEKTRQEYLAYYFNKAQEWGKEVVTTFKQQDLPRDVGVEDYEKGRLDRLTDYPWLTDDTISWGSWCYTNGLKIKSTKTVLHTFIDIVSKNGILLLNISPKADGTIPNNQRHVLEELGQWLEINGQAIYGTRPWKVFGQGPTRMKKSGHFVGRLDYTNNDIRFTRSKDSQTLYAICLGWPDRDIVLDVAQVKNIAEDAKIQLLGSDVKVTYTANSNQALTINLPQLNEDQLPGKYAHVFALTGFDLDINPFELPGVLTLKAEQAVLGGDALQLEDKYGPKNIGFWDNPEDSIHWLLKMKKAGQYRVRGTFSSPNGESSLVLEVGGKQVALTVPQTESWGDTILMDIGTIEVGNSGVYHLILKPESQAAYKGINFWKLDFAPIQN